MSPASWSVDRNGARHTLTVSATGVSTSEIGKQGPTFAGSYGLSEILEGKRAAEWRERFGAEIYEAALGAIREILAAWRPPEVTETRETCTVCSTLPGEIYADLRAGASLPQTGFVEAAKLFSGAVLRCPRCATYYRFRNEYEFGHEDTDTLTRLTVDQAIEAIAPMNHLEAAWLKSRR